MNEDLRRRAGPVGVDGTLAILRLTPIGTTTQPSTLHIVHLSLGNSVSSSPHSASIYYENFRWDLIRRSHDSAIVLFPYLGLHALLSRLRKVP